MEVPEYEMKQIKMEVPEFDPNFEPPFRARSNTWPLRPRETIKTEDDSRSTATPTGSDGGCDNLTVTDAAVSKDSVALKGKTTSRRNAWGNLSYADLITKAIEGSPEKRLTLSQIYDWMVQNVPYFKDKGDTNSSAGWKNSIRHNLSLHSRFMRIQNEGTGKSSWWVLNPDAKPGKSPRRRATSMDTKAYEKKRSRVKKKLDQLRALGVDHSPKSSDYGDSDLGHGIDPFSLSPQDFRARTSSNASSLGGRLSPIQSMYEPDLHDRQVPPMSPIAWNRTSSYSPSEGFTETLSESMAEMFVGDSLSLNGGGELGRSSLSTPSPLQPQSSPSGYLPAPPAYTETRHASPQQLSPHQNNSGDNGMTTGPCMDSAMSHPTGMSCSMNPMMNSISTSMGGQDLFLDDSFLSQTLSCVLDENQPSGMSSQLSGQCANNLQQNNDDGSMMATAAADNTEMNSSLLRQALTEKQQLLRSQLQTALLKQNQHQRQLLQERLKQLQQRELLQQRLQMQIQQQQQMKQQQMLQQQYDSIQQQRQQQPGLPQCSPGSLQQNHNLMAGGVVQEINTSDTITDLELDYAYPGDLDLVTIAEQTTEDLDCNVDEIISHELSMDGLLEFNFDGSGNNNGSSVVQT